MRQEVRQHKYGVDQFTMFSASEIPELVAKHGSNFSFGSWVGDKKDAFMQKVVLGDESLVASSEQFLEKIEDQVPMSRGWRNVDDVVGAVPNIPAFLAGHPQHMRRRHRVAKENAPLAIYMDLTSSAMIEADKVTRRGVVLLALARMLVEHRPVELWVGTTKGRPGYAGTVAWRIDTAPLDLARAAYHIGAAAMARGFGYGLDNAIHKTGGAWAWGDYDPAKHSATAQDRLTPIIGCSELLFVPPIFGFDPLLNDPVAWIRAALKKYVGETDATET